MQPTRPMPPRRLTRGQIDRFHEDGFVVVPGVFSRAEIARMGRAFDRLRRLAESLTDREDFRGARFVLDRTPDRTVIHRIVWCGTAAPVLGGFGRDERLVEMAADLLGSERMDHLINQAHFKQPNDGVAFPWHQDSSNRRFGTEWTDVNGRGSYVQTAIAVDDHTEHNGPLRFIPGSNRLGHLGLERDGVELTDHVDTSRAVSATMRAGSVLLFGPYTVHCSSPNVSTVPRRTLINGYAYPGANARSYPGCGLGVRLTAAS